jgi:O-methyltransferase domain
VSDATPKGLPPEAAATRLMYQLGTGYMLSSSLQVVLRLGIADRLAGGPRTTAELAQAVGVNEDALYRVMRALASVGVFEEKAPREFALTLPADLLRADHAHSVRPMLLWISSPFHFRVYSNMMHAVRTGKPASEETVGVPVFEYLARDHDLSELFNDAMTNFSAAIAPAVLKSYDFSGVNLLVDIAGGHGETLMSILGQYPSMRGILFDLEHVVAGAPKRIEALGLKDRCRTASGDFFTAVPGGGDLYILQHVIHDWDDDRAATILKAIHTALAGKRNGRVLLIESVLQPGNEPDMGKLIDLEMLVMPGGRERTADEFSRLLSSAGFTLTRIVPTPSMACVIEATPQ